MIEDMTIEEYMDFLDEEERMYQRTCGHMQEIDLLYGKENDDESVRNQHSY